MKWKTMKLSEEEVATVMAMRKLRKADAERPKVPVELLEHGFVSVKRAAELLSVKVSDLKSRRSGDGPPVLTNNRVPISELRREHHRQTLKVLRELAAEASRLADGTCHTNIFSSALYQWERRARYDHDVARELNVTLAEAKRLMKEELFCWLDRRNRRYVTPEELAAFKRKRVTLSVAA